MCFHTEGIANFLAALLCPEALNALRTARPCQKIGRNGCGGLNGLCLALLMILGVAGNKRFCVMNRKF
jgi:hypothetical protein